LSLKTRRGWFGSLGLKTIGGGFGRPYGRCMEATNPGCAVRFFLPPRNSGLSLWNFQSTLSCFASFFRVRARNCNLIFALVCRGPMDHILVLLSLVGSGILDLGTPFFSIGLVCLIFRSSVRVFLSCVCGVPLCLVCVFGGDFGTMA
jgi:hypothetical protein